VFGDNLSAISTDPYDIVVDKLNAVAYFLHQLELVVVALNNFAAAIITDVFFHSAVSPPYVVGDPLRLALHACAVVEAFAFAAAAVAPAIPAARATDAFPGLTTYIQARDLAGHSVRLHIFALLCLSFGPEIVYQHFSQV
jgi:hypothetical protein